MSIKLLVADDHEVVRSGIGTLLDGSDIEIVGLCGTVEETVSLTKSAHPDVVLLDVRLGSEDGLTALEQIRTEAPEVTVVMMSTYDNPTYVARAIALGATDYVLKDSSRLDILEAIQHAASREQPSEPSILRRIQTTMKKRKDTARRPAWRRADRILQRKHVRNHLRCHADIFPGPHAVRTVLD